MWASGPLVSGTPPTVRPEMRVRRLVTTPRSRRSRCRAGRRAEGQIALEDESDRLSLVLPDQELALTHLAAERDDAPDQMPLRFEAAILSRMRSPVTSRSNWAKENSTLRVSRPMLVVVLNDWVTETNETPCASKISTSLAGQL